MEVEKAKCECCGFTEECTPTYIAAVRAEYRAEAVGDEIRREGSAITTAEALNRHVAFAHAAPSYRTASAAEDDLMAAVARLLHRCLVDSPSASPPASRKVAAGPRCHDGADE